MLLHNNLRKDVSVSVDHLAGSSSAIKAPSVCRLRSGTLTRWQDIESLERRKCSFQCVYKQKHVRVSFIEGNKKVAVRLFEEIKDEEPTVQDLSATY